MGLVPSTFVHVDAPNACGSICMRAKLSPVLYHASRAFLDDVERQNLCGRTQEPYGRLTGKREFAGLFLSLQTEQNGKANVRYSTMTSQMRLHGVPAQQIGRLGVRSKQPGQSGCCCSNGRLLLLSGLAVIADCLRMPQPKDILVIRRVYTLVLDHIP